MSPQSAVMSHAGMMARFKVVCDECTTTPEIPSNGIPPLTNTQCARRCKYALISPHTFLVLWDQRVAGLCLWTWRQSCAAVSLVRVIVTITVSGFSPCMHHVTWMRAETLPGWTKGQLFALGSPFNCGVRAGNYSQVQVFFLPFFRSPKVKIILSFRTLPQSSFM